ncbi:hypothetical protein [Streptomyces sp. NPDC058657]|uniref:hypothetical protein n=1 Tax=unclassified Streptomyces TaxID=2593676 RepID=UPI003659467C
MPEESRVQSAANAGWTTSTELLAQIVEEISILAAEKRREEPKTIPRPYSSATRSQKRSRGSQRAPSEQAATEQAAPHMAGHRQMLMAAMQKGMVRSG